MSKRNRRTSKRRGGSMSNMRSGFKGAFGKSRGGRADPMQFIYILAGLFVFGALVFFGTR